MIGIITLCAVAAFVAHRLYAKSKKRNSSSSSCSSTIESIDITEPTPSPRSNSTAELCNASTFGRGSVDMRNPQWATIWEPVNNIRRQQHRQEQRIPRLRTTLRSHPYNGSGYIGFYNHCARLHERMARMEQQMASNLNTILHLTQELNMAYRMNTGLRHL
ncbi:hypothetical protein COEREDRAFT_6878 [Coemansia reversa NRRL 1564]|uniref:Uncharacterized protein n=1 Tax=Coemansia reversa (strain ATCC 12441 / NRRL 1564) TaxID=763665 RepID=A0A2G5BGP1_COERN|nr:hypothetical protein COEREDRAFT_6878 [Coemansia reversa NRRL 1564]|eukprot:PIA18142.1 hypothetical protein COEREDRAFT_6878 [Coemansia reversa NRRL 1564]